METVNELYESYSKIFTSDDRPKTTMKLYNYKGKDYKFRTFSKCYQNDRINYSYLNNNYQSFVIDLIFPYFKLHTNLKLIRLIINDNTVLGSVAYPTENTLYDVFLKNQTGSHANFMYYDKRTDTFEHFEPHGDTKKYKHQIELMIKTIGIKNFIQSSNCNSDGGLQSFDSFYRNLSEPIGYCFYWAILMLEMRANNDHSINSIQKAFQQFIREYITNNYCNQGFIVEKRKNVIYIREYFLYLHNLIYKIVYHMPRDIPINFYLLRHDEPLLKYAWFGGDDSCLLKYQHPKEYIMRTFDDKLKALNKVGQVVMEESKQPVYSLKITFIHKGHKTERLFLLINILNLKYMTEYFKRLLQK
jgi:hypothetical protein